MKKVYIRTDKNGTKIYHDYTCTRCGGAGYSEEWRFTGMTCYKCGGTGKQDTPQVIKVYTPEYEAKLAEQRAKRHEKQRLQRVAELKEKLPEMLMEKGFNAEGKVYAATGDTYSIKDELKEVGAHWKPRLNSWIFTEPHPEYHTVEISWEEVIEPNFEGGWLDWKDINPSELIQSKLPKVEKPVSQYVGEVGKRLEAEVTLVDVFGGLRCLALLRGVVLILRWCISLRMLAVIFWYGLLQGMGWMLSSILRALSLRSGVR